MGWKAMAWAWKQDCRGAKKLLLLAMADMASHDYLCWPAIKYLSEMIGSDERYTQRLIRSLEKDKIVTRETRKRKDGGFGANFYRINVVDDATDYHQAGGSHYHQAGGSHYPPLKEQSIEQSVESTDKASPKPEAPKPEEKAEEKPYEITTPQQRVMCSYKICLGLDAKDRAWDKANWGKWIRAADKLLDAFGGQPNPAIDFMDAFRTEMARLGREPGKSWNMATVASRAWDDAATAAYRGQK
jgi:hypothetical protein